MAKISYADVNYGQQNNSTQNQKKEWFALKNNGDQALVRIMEDSLENLEILTVHQDWFNGKRIKINCIREANDPIDACPLCKAESDLTQKVFIRLLEYAPDGTATPKIWERPASFVKIIKSKLDNYGPLSECLFTITRCGVAGDVNTTYNIDFAPPMKYPVENFPKQNGCFNNYSALGTAVFDKSFDELSYFIQNKEFPSKKSEGNAQANAQATAPAPAPAPVPQPAYEEIPVQAQPKPTAPSNQAPWGNQPQQVQKPKRYY